jgi:hypothetical protein
MVVVHNSEGFRSDWEGVLFAVVTRRESLSVKLVYSYRGAIVPRGILSLNVFEAV